MHIIKFFIDSIFLLAIIFNSLNYVVGDKNIIDRFMFDNIEVTIENNITY